MNETAWERWGAASGLVAVAAGAAALLFERGAVSPNDPADEIVRFFAANGSAQLMQSVLFVIGAAALLWFISGLRAFLAVAEGGTGRLSMLVFGAGITQIVLNLMAQAFQIGATMTPPEQMSAGLVAMMNATFALANVPLAVMLAAVAAVSLRYLAFPRWLGWIAAAAAVAYALLSVSVAVDSGPLAPGGALSYVLYPSLVLWQVPAAIIMIIRIGRGAAVELAPSALPPHS
ncbi:hypothetical protein AB0H88_47725 [Nonomuraea sp. NPDC050680]|uniref:hypothetical protein n=1 Tax=Nonomuraea sp. NPDC050680 TaxID=3154630 RepID=UPI0033EE5116